MTVNTPVSPGDLFVFYGLLKEGASGMPAHIDLAAAGAFLGPCRFRARMVDLGGFPGVAPGDTLCHGVRYRLDDASLGPALDEFEDVIPGDLANSLYRRERVGLRDEAGAPTGEQAWIYWYNQSVDGRPEIASGDWPLDAGRPRKGG